MNNIKILIVGGYGVFGGRIIELLENEATLSFIIAGRSLEKAQKYCQNRGKTKATLIPAYFDRLGNLETQLNDLQPDIVIDASGPFQNYGANCYDLIKACITHKINYLDIADGAAFVTGAKEFDAAAKAAGIFVLSGVSSFPVLTALVVRELSTDTRKIETIHGGVAPSPYAGVGENVIRAIASYAGQPITVKRKGTETNGYPFTDSLKYTIAPPGYTPLNKTLFSLVDVPDLYVLPEFYPDAKTVWMGAGPVPPILHRTLIIFAWLVRFNILKSLTPIVKLIQFAVNNFRWGEHRGGMFVEITGLNKQARRIKKSWHLLAEGDHGPLIPCMAIEAVLRKILKGHKIQPGSRTAIDDLNLTDYESIFSKYTIYTGFRTDSPKTEQGLYAEILGDAWKTLPSPIKAMHDIKKKSHVSGQATILRGRNPLTNIAANIIGFPKAGNDVPVTVDFSIENGKEKWLRTFDEKSFLSHQYAGTKCNERLLVERFGPTEFSMALVPNDKQELHLILRHWKFLKIPLPLWLAPRSHSYEFVQEGRFHFHVDITYPLLGRIVYYKGWLEQKS